MEMCSVVVIDQSGVVDQITVFQGEDKSIVSAKAEKYFRELIAEQFDWNEEQYDDVLNDGYAHLYDGRTICITWPEIKVVSLSS